MSIGSKLAGKLGPFHCSSLRMESSSPGCLDMGQLLGSKGKAGSCYRRWLVVRHMLELLEGIGCVVET